jgi:hypothetical protein
MTGKVEEIKKDALVGATAERAALRLAFMTAVAKAIMETAAARHEHGTARGEAMGQVAREMGMAFAGVIAQGVVSHPTLFAAGIAAHFEHGVAYGLGLAQEGGQ